MMRYILLSAIVINGAVSVRCRKRQQVEERMPMIDTKEIVDVEAPKSSPASDPNGTLKKD